MSKTTIPTGGITADAIDATLIADDAVSEEHLDNTALTGFSELTSLADADKFLISDASDSNNIKYVQKSNMPAGEYVRVGGSASSSNVADITLDNILSSTYYQYLVTGMMETTEDAYMEIILRTGSSGSNANAGGAYSQCWNGWAVSSSDAYLENSGDTGANSIRPMSAASGTKNDGDDDHGVYFSMVLYTRYLTKTYWRCNSQFLNNDKSRIYGYENVGWQLNTGAITGFNFFF